MERVENFQKRWEAQTADSYVTKYGAGVLRLWVCSEDFRRDIPLSDEILGQVVRAYRTLRNTIRFQLGTLFDFSAENDAVELSAMTPIDLWALSQSNIMIEEVSNAFENFELHRAVQIINRFCSGPLSSTYHDIIKDRLYTLHPDAPARRSTQTAIHLIFDALIRVIGPSLPLQPTKHGPSAIPEWNYPTTRSFSKTGRNPMTSEEALK